MEVKDEKIKMCAIESFLREKGVFTGKLTNEQIYSCAVLAERSIPERNALHDCKILNIYSLLNEKKLNRLKQEGEVDFSILVKKDYTSNQKITAAEFIQDFNRQNENSLKVTKEFKEEVTPILERVLVKRGVGMTDEAIQKLAAELTEVDPLQEVSFRGSGPLTHRLAACHLRHAACPVPVGIIKAVEVAVGLALPADATIKVSK